MTRAIYCFPLLLSLSLAAPPPASTGLESLSVEQRAEAKLRLEEYQKAQFDPLERHSVVKQVLKLPQPVQKVFLGVVDADVTKALAGYRAEFQKATDALLKSRESKEVKDDIKKLRASVMALHAMGGALTKEKIVEVGDPALEKLRDYQTFNREMVMKRNSSLEIPRERLTTLLTCRQELRESLSIKDGKDFTPEKLLEEETALTTKASPYDKDAIKIMQANIKLQAGVPPEEAEGVRFTNELRATLGLSAQVIDPKLCNAARGHSKDMVEQHFFAHESPVPGKKTPWDRAKLAGTSAGAENIFAGSPKPDAAVMAWWHSPGHFLNMLNPGHKRMGMGRHDGNWTQMFGG